MQPRGTNLPERKCREKIKRDITLVQVRQLVSANSDLWCRKWQPVRTQDCLHNRLNNTLSVNNSYWKIVYYLRYLRNYSPCQRYPGAPTLGKQFSHKKLASLCNYVTASLNQHKQVSGNYSTSEQNQIANLPIKKLLKYNLDVCSNMWLKLLH